MLELLERKYRARRPDLIVASTSVGLRFVLEQRARLFAGIPVVFLAVQRAAVANLTIPPDVTGTWLSADWAGTLDAALGLQPHTRQVMVVGGASSRDEIWLASARAQLAPYQGRLAIRYSSPAPLAETLRIVASLPAMPSCWSARTSAMPPAASSPLGTWWHSWPRNHGFRSTPYSRATSAPAWWAGACSAPPPMARRPVAWRCECCPGITPGRRSPAPTFTSSTGGSSSAGASTRVESRPAA